MRPHLSAVIRRLKRIRLSDAIVGPVLRLPRWLLGLAAIVLFTTAVGLAVAGGVGSVGASIGRSLLTALIVGLLGWLWFGYYTSEEFTGELRRRAQTAPESLFPRPPRVGAASNVVGRDELVADLVTALHAEMRTGPQVIVGDSGSGKTSFLLRLAATLAQEHDVLPIVVSLQGKEEIDFYALARERFGEYIDPHVRVSGDVDRLWRWLSRRGKLVILADDLDRAKLPDVEEDPNRRSVRAALDASNRRGLPLVVTSRPYGVPRDLTEPPLTLGPLEVEPTAAAQHIVDSAGVADDALVADYLAIIEAAIERGSLFENVFYLDLVRDLVRSRRLSRFGEGSKHAVRIALLDLWYEGLLGDRLTEEEEERRRHVLADVSEFAAATLATTEDPQKAKNAAHTAARSLQSIERVGNVVLLDDDGQYRFVHEVIHAYLAARAIVCHPETAVDAVDQRPDDPRLQLAVVLAAAQTHDARFCHDVCERFLGSSVRGDDPEGRLLRAAAAAEVALAGDYGGLDSRIAAECAAARTGASPIARRVALDQLAGLGGEGAIEALWEYVADAHYGVRWAAVEKLVARCSGTELSSRDGYLAGGAAYRVLARHIERDLARARTSLAGGRQPDDWEPEILPLKLMGWVLPALRTALESSGDSGAASTATRQLDELLRLESDGVTAQRGLEASIAQGFKVDARLFRHEAVDEQVIVRLDRERAFWYSQLNLLHALTLRGARSGVDSSKSTLQRFVAGDEQHPFVRATAKLCLKALKEAENGDAAEADHRIDRYVWDDESVVVSRAPRKLVEEAIQLVGEMMILLNLNESGTPEQRLMFGDATRLPYCFQGSRDRKEVFERCVDGATCDFRLCPIRPPLDRLSARRDISRAFCRHQRFHASARTARLWGSRVQKRALQEFWLRIESAARF